MIKVEKVEVFNFEGAIRGMRNPMNSWNKSDSGCGHIVIYDKEHPYGQVKFSLDPDEFVVGPHDLTLMQTLYKGGPVHAKYLRQIFVSLDIVAPLYWWKEFDTYKVGTTANSCSTMHKIHAKEFTIDDFSHEHLNGETIKCLGATKFDLSPLDLTYLTVDVLNACRSKYLATQNKNDWWQMIQLLPSSYNQKRTVTMNYQNIMNMLDWRTTHKLDEWVEFCKTLRTLPYVKEIRGEE